MLCWIDLETTGLVPEQGEILEVALVVTDNDLAEVAAREWVLEYHPQRLAEMKSGAHKVVQDMHEKNALWAECNGVDLDAEAPHPGLTVWPEVLDEMRRWTVAKAGPICGSTIAFDRRWLEVHAPAVAGHFSHRNLDVSVLGEMAKLWAPEVYEKRPKGGGHRALPDICGSIELMRYWRANLPEVLR